MKREIRFRGLAKDGRWYYGDLIADDMGARICYVVNMPPSYSEPGGDTQFIKINVDYETVGEYTGLKDKNGVDIFEGDFIMLHEYGNGIYKEVVFHNGSFCIHGFNWDRQTVEVIGNIHQHPELL